MYGGFSERSDVLIILGGRAINNGNVDKQIGAEMKAMVLFFSLPPNMFSVCMTRCLEELTVDTSSSDSIFTTGFDRATRRLELLGQASPEAYQLVLQTLRYTNVVSRLYPDRIALNVSDGVHTVRESIPLVAPGNTMGRRRRSSVPMRHLYRSRQLNSKDDVSINSKEPGHQNKVEEVKHTELIIPALVVFVLLAVMLTIFSIRRTYKAKTDSFNLLRS